MASQSQNSNTPAEELDEQVEVVEVQESETFADNSVDLDEAMSPEAKAAKKHIEDLAKKNNKSFGDMRMHIDDFPGKHDRKTQAAAKALNKHQYGSYGEEVEQVDEVDRGFGQRMKAADAAANIYSKEKRKPDNREIDKIRAKYRAQRNNQSQSEEVEQAEEEVLEQKNCGCGKNPCETYGKVEEKTLTPAEKKKREEVAKAIERDNPKMPMDKKMAIATATAKKVAENIEDRHADAYERVTKHLDKVKSPEHKAKFQKKLDTHLKSFDYHYEKDTGQEHHAVDDMHDLANDIKKHNSKMSESSISDRTKRLIERAINRKS